MKGFRAILVKEFTHLRRQRSTLVFAVVVPALQLTIFGFAANLTLDNIPVAVLDLDGRQESRAFQQAVENTGTFTITHRVTSAGELHRAISSGRVRAGIVIPPSYSERLLRQEQARVQILVDGGDSQVATTTLNTMTLLATSLSLRRAKIVAEAVQVAPSRAEAGEPALPIEARTRLLYNPDLQDSHFFVPGLIAIILQLVLTFLTAFSIVGERENGTLEQLFVTPVSPVGLLLGKLTPYVLLAAGELLIILVLMVALFGVPIHGSLALLLALSGLFICTVLGLGLLVSTLARTQLQAMQIAFMFMLSSVLLSGFVFPRAEMPCVLYLLSYLLPVTYFLEIVRGVVLRASDTLDLVPWILGLTTSFVVIVALSLLRFRKQLD